MYFQHWLKPGGQVLVSEYINQRETPQLSKKYIEYLKLRGYQLITVRDYGNILKRLVTKATILAIVLFHDCIDFRCINTK